MARGANMPLDEDLRIPPATASADQTNDDRPNGAAN
jgi:hypothetical protein